MSAMVDNWLSNLQEEAEKVQAFNEAKQKVEGNAEFKKQIECFDIMLNMLKKKREEILLERQKFETESINKALKEMNSKYRIREGEV